MTSSPQILDPASVAAELIAAPGSAVAPAPALPAANVNSSASVPAASSSAEPADASSSANPFAGVVDKKFRPFDPLRHKMKNGAPFINADGYFMPIGGRPKKTAASEPALQASGLAPAVSAPPAALPAPAAPAWSDAEKSAAAAPSPEAAAPGSASASEVVAVPAGPDYSVDAGKAISAGVFVLAGVVFGAREETTPPKQEAAHLTDATAAWIRSTGWRGGPLAGMLLAWTAYFLGLAEKPKVGAKLREWFGPPKADPKPAIDVQATPVAATPPASTPKPAAAPAPAFAGERY